VSGRPEAPVPLLVAHRGHASRHPENTLVALESALRAGVHGVEFDVQITADGIPVLIHDEHLLRTAGLDRDVRRMTFAETRAVSVHERARLGEAERDVAMPSLAEAVELLCGWPEAVPFVEIKPESATAYRADDVTARVMDVIAPIMDRAVVISFSERVVMTARRLGAAAVGWCVRYPDQDSLTLARAIAPEYLVADHRNIGGDRAGALWPGDWLWMLYEVVDADLAMRLAARGAAIVETMACAELYSHTGLAIRRRTPGDTDAGGRG